MNEDQRFNLAMVESIIYPNDNFIAFLGEILIHEWIMERIIESLENQVLTFVTLKFSMYSMCLKSKFLVTVINQIKSHCVM